MKQLWDDNLFKLFLFLFLAASLVVTSYAVLKKNKEKAAVVAPIAVPVQVIESK